MQKKEELLSMDTPLRFIFSHSALREGWDNPNVFQICTLNQTASGIKKRQEIGRGLRLPVDKDGMRVFDESVNRLYVMANESYEDFARALQIEYEEDCGVTFGKVPLAALARITRVVDGVETPIGKVAGEAIRAALVDQNMLNSEGRIGSAFDPKKPGFALAMPARFDDLKAAVIDVLSGHQIERHIRRDKDERNNRLRKEIFTSPEFEALWNKIKPKTTYRVEFTTDDLVSRAVAAIKSMSKIEAPKISVTTGALDVIRGGVDSRLIGSGFLNKRVPVRVLDVFEHLATERSLANRRKPGLQLAERVRIVAAHISRTETFGVTEGVIINDADQAVQLHQRVLQRGRREQYFRPRRNCTAYRLSNLARCLVDIAKPMRFIDDNKIPFRAADIWIFGANELVGTQHDPRLLERIEVPGFHRSIEALRFENH